MHKIFIVASKDLQARLAKTILARGDFGRKIHPDMRTVTLDIIVKEPPDLLLLHDGGFGAVRSFLDEFGSAYPNPPFPVLIIQECELEIPYPEVVTEWFPFDFDIRAFNARVARFLGLPTRRSARFLVRLGVSLHKTEETVLATSTSVSATGMLIESSKSLEVGGEYMVQIMGVRRIQVPPLKIRILRMETRVQAAAGQRVYAGEFVGVPMDAMQTVVEALVPA